ncbi:MAG TPA: hypothetical protein VNN80_19635, partial [Polyangiaceae bacterium]|nr:hypothetical protein [Polyangiaceae bacterium]
MSYARRQRATASSRRRAVGLGWGVRLVTLASCAAACARFGYERHRPERDAGAAGSGVLADAASPVGGGPPGAAADGGAGAPPGPDPSASCFDGARNGDEVGVDCGGADCAPCNCSLGVAEKLGDPNYPGNDLWSPRLASDGLSLYVAVTVPGVGEQIVVSTRPDAAAAFGLGDPLPAPVNTGKEGTPFLTSDGLSLYFYSERAGGAGARDLYVATRPSSADAFGDVTPLTSLNGAELDYLPWLSADGLTIYFASGPAGSGDIQRSTRASVSAAFLAPEAVSELNSSSDEGGITVSADGLEAIFASNRPGGVGARDLYRATRARVSDPFSAPAPVDALNTPDN